MGPSPESTGRGPTSGFDSEAAAYLQGRLRLVAGALAIGVSGLFVVVRVLQFVLYDLDPNRLLPTKPFDLIHLGSLLLLLRFWHGLRREGVPLAELGVRDAVLLWVMMASGLALYWLGAPDSLPYVFSSLCLLVVARAVVVPSGGRRTLRLTIPVVPALVAIAILRGPEGLLEAQYVADVVLKGVILLAAVLLATLASRVNFTLRRQVYEAKRVGPYEFVEKIGEGAMGEVWRATHSLLKRPTAIKLLRPEITGADTLTRFEREVMLTSRLTHPNTISIYDYGRTADGVFYYAMEYLDGADLEKIVKATGPLPPARVLHVLDQVCGALEEAHETGLVHRDVKPGNIHLCRRGRDFDVVKVLDFGLVRDTKSESPSITRSGAFVGTPITGAPERFFGADGTPASDLYSLGATAYFLLTGDYPFVGSTVMETVQMHLHDSPAPPSSRREGIPADLDRIVLRCLAKEPADRPPGAAALREDLARCDPGERWNQADAREWWRANGERFRNPEL